MNFNEFVERDEHALEKASKCRDIAEFKRLVDEHHIDYSGEEELKNAWSWVKSQAKNGDGSLDDDALDSVAGGKKDSYNTSNTFNNCTGATGGSSYASSN